MSFKAPIAVMSFDRPDYLYQVLESVAHQQDCATIDSEIYLFQDGALNAASGEMRADSKNINECERVFKNFFPKGQAFVSPFNLGVALSFERAEKFVFEQLGSDAAIFLEDDLVLAPYYMEALDRLIQLALQDQRIGYVAAYGHHWLPKERQEKNPAKLVLLEHNWAFALTKRQWLINQERVSQYLSLVRDIDYKLRGKMVGRDIKRLYHSWGAGVPGDSQDRTKTIATTLSGSVKVNVTACMGKYIGAVGLHMNPKMYENRGYSKTEMFMGKLPSLGELSNETYSELLRIQFKWANEKPFVETP